MCGKYYADREFIPRLSSLFSEEEIYPDADLRKEWDAVLSGSPGTFKEQDISPTDSGVTIFSSGGKLVASKMNWGFRDPYHDTLVINARAESVFEKSMFRDSIRERRCVIPASGYYEWDRAKARYRFSVPDGGLILLAGFYRMELGKPHYTIITTCANECMAPVHTRMPVALDKKDIRKWLTDDDSVHEYLEQEQEELKREQDAGQISMDLGI